MAFALNSQGKYIELKLPNNTAFRANAVKINLKLFSSWNPLVISLASPLGSGSFSLRFLIPWQFSVFWQGLKEHCGMQSGKAPFFSPTRILERKMAPEKETTRSLLHADDNGVASVINMTPFWGSHQFLNFKMLFKIPRLKKNPFCKCGRWIRTPKIRRDYSSRSHKIFLRAYCREILHL